MTLMIPESSPEALPQAIKFLRAGEVISFATETVYALACDASNSDAVSRLYRLKEREAEKAIAIFTKNVEMATQYLTFNATQKKIAEHFMPGELTLILQKKTDSAAPALSPLLNKNGNSLGLRIPNHQFTLALLNAFDGVIAATSANKSGQPAAISADSSKIYFDQKIPLIIDGGICRYQLPSTILKIEDDGNILVLREGRISAEQIINYAVPQK